MSPALRMSGRGPTRCPAALVLHLLGISEGGAVVHKRSPVTPKSLPSLSLRLCPAVLCIVFPGPPSPARIRVHSLHVKQAPSSVPSSRNFQSSFIYCPDNNQGPRLGLHRYCKLSKSTFPNVECLPLLSGDAGCEHDVLGLVFPIVLFSNIYPFKQPRYLMLKGHLFC